MINEKQAKKYCFEDLSLIENYAEAAEDKTRVWDLHHKNEIIMNCGHKELIAVGAYYDRPARELVFLTHGEHTRLHSKGKVRSEETKRKLSANNGSRRPEVRARISEMAKKRPPVSEETRRKQSESGKNKPWWNDGARETKAKECPPGFVKGRLKRKSGD